MRKIFISVILACLNLCFLAVNVTAEEIVVGKEKEINENVYIMGDASTDKRISARDALMILKYAAKIELYDENFVRISDVNSDTAVNAKDSLLVLQYAADILPKFINEDQNSYTYDGDMDQLKEITEPSKDIPDNGAANYEANIFRLSYIYSDGNSNFDSYSEELVHVITDYESYIKYMDSISLYYGSNLPDQYTEEYFTNNDVIVVRFWNNSGSISNRYIEMIEEKGQYHLYFEKHHPCVGTEDMALWNVIIPVEGKQWNDKEFYLNFINIYDTCEYEK